MNTHHYRRVAVVLVWGMLIVIGCTIVQETEAPAPHWIGEIDGEGSVEVAIHGHVAMVSAAPHDGWEFVRWVGPNDISEENPHNIGTSRLAYYTAVFASIGDIDTNGPPDDGDTNGPPDDGDTNGPPEDEALGSF